MRTPKTNLDFETEIIYSEFMGLMRCGVLKLLSNAILAAEFIL
jgi:hypothetical protein